MKSREVTARAEIDRAIVSRDDHGRSTVQFTEDSSGLQTSVCNKCIRPLSSACCLHAIQRTLRTGSRAEGAMEGERGGPSDGRVDGYGDGESRSVGTVRVPGCRAPSMDFDRLIAELISLPSATGRRCWGGCHAVGWSRRSESAESYGNTCGASSTRSCTV